NRRDDRMVDICIECKWRIAERLFAKIARRNFITRGRRMKERKYFCTFDAGEVDSWKYCPRCGEEILEIYPGDYFGHIACINDKHDEDIEFKIEWEESE